MNNLIEKKYMEWIKIISITLLSALVLILSACGANSPISGTPATTPTAAQTTITMTVMFPPRNGPTGYMAPNPLISASTDSISINVYQSGTTTIYGTGTILAPASGGTASVSVVLSKYAAGSTVDVEIAGSNNLYGQNGWVKKTNLTVTAGTNTNLSVAYVEAYQGVANVPATFLTAPDGTNYTVNDIFLDKGMWGFYELGMRLTNASAATVGYHYSTANVSASNSIGVVSMIVDGLITLPLDVPAASSTTLWNRYDVTFNFAPGGVPTNTPTITGTYIGAFMNVSGTVVPTTSSGTPTGFSIPTASWSNNIAPLNPASVTILF